MQVTGTILILLGLGVGSWVSYFIENKTKNISLTVKTDFGESCRIVGDLCSFFLLYGN